MIIPSIYLPIDTKLFDYHFNIFFLDYSQKYREFDTYTLNRIDIGTVGFRYVVEYEGHYPLIPPKPKMVVCEIEALTIGDNRIEIRAATLDSSYLPDGYANDGAGDAFLWQFYNMIDLKWNIKLFIPGIKGLDELPLEAARIKFDADFGIHKIYKELEEIYSDNDERDEVVKENITPHPGSEAERLIRKIDEYYNLLAQGLPPIETNNEVTPTAQNQKRGPSLNTRERAEIIKKIKDSHLNWSYSRVAMEVSKEFGEYISPDAVRNYYRAMGWKWRRADRV